MDNQENNISVLSTQEYNEIYSYLNFIVSFFLVLLQVKNNKIKEYKGITGLNTTWELILKLSTKKRAEACLCRKHQDLLKNTQVDCNQSYVPSSDRLEPECSVQECVCVQFI